jgi:hypothetical protein
MVNAAASRQLNASHAPRTSRAPHCSIGGGCLNVVESNSVSIGYGVSQEADAASSASVADSRAVKLLQRSSCTAPPLGSEPRGLPVFQIVRCILAENGEVAARQPLQPLFDLWEDATAIAEFDSSRLSGDYGYDEARDCWWASDSSGRMYRFEVEQVAAADVAA